MNVQYCLTLFSDQAKEIHARDGETKMCSMCGDLYAVMMVRELFEGLDKKE